MHVPFTLQLWLSDEHSSISADHIRFHTISLIETVSVNFFYDFANNFTGTTEDP